MKTHKLKLLLSLYRLDVFRVKAPYFTLSATPSSNVPVMVFLNGLLMLEGVDYCLSGNMLTFTGQEVTDNPIIQVRYWVIP